MAGVAHASTLRAATVLALLVGASIARAEYSNASAPRAAGDPVCHVVVRLYNHFGVPDESIARAQLAAASILRRAGIDSAWRHCATPTHASRLPPDPCDQGVAGGDLMVRIVATPSEIPDEGTLGFAMVDARAGSGVLSTVLADRIDSMARRTKSDGAMLLGRAIAHELGHLLLGSISHSQHGLMRAQWTDREVRLNWQLDWMFSNREEATMRSNLAARARIGTQTALSASNDP
jgi:hypothetical protein